MTRSNGIAACCVLLAASLLTVGCGSGTDAAPAERAEPAASPDPALPARSAPQIECGTGTDAVPPEPAEAFSPVLPAQPVPPGEAVPDGAAPPHTVAPEAVPEASDPDPCALSVSRSAEPGEAADALEYWTPERMESAIPEMPTVDK